MGWHRKVHWLIAYGFLCVIEFFIHKAKEHVELKFKPKEEDGDEDDDDDDDGEEPARKKKRR